MLAAGAPEPRQGVLWDATHCVPAEQRRGPEGVEAAAEGVGCARGLHGGHVGHHWDARLGHLERHPPQDEHSRRLHAVRSLTLSFVL